MTELLNELSKWFLEIKPEGVSLELVKHSVSFLDYFSKQTVKLPCTAVCPDCNLMYKEKLLASLNQQLLNLTRASKKFLESLIENLESQRKKLRQLLDDLKQWSPSQNQKTDQEKKLIRDKLRRFLSGGGFSTQRFLETSRVLQEQHQLIAEKVQQLGVSLERFQRKECVKKVISTTIKGFLLVALICIVAAFGVHNPVLALCSSLTTVVMKVVNWDKLGLWVDRRWKKKMEELRLKERYRRLQYPMDKRLHVLSDLRPVYLSVEELIKILIKGGRSSEELLRLQKRLLSKLEEAIPLIESSKKEANSCKEKLREREQRLLKHRKERRQGRPAA